MKQKFTYMDMHRGVTYCAISNDVNGNERFVIHFLSMLNQNDINELSIEEQYRYACDKARAIGGRRYRAKWYGGGIVFTTPDIRQTIDKLILLRED